MVTRVPPAIDPRSGTTDVMIGGGVYVNRSALLKALVPMGLVTVMSTVPDPGGLGATIVLSVFTATVEAATSPNFTPVAPVTPLPWMKPHVPPDPPPPVGSMLVTTGSGTDAAAPAV